MRITRIHLKNFKRFTDLVIQDIPSTAKLVLVVGPNGSGKSSLFDAFLHWYRLQVGFGRLMDDLFYVKDQKEAFDLYKNVEVTIEGNQQLKKGSLYVRTAHRNDPDFSISGINQLDSPIENIRVNRSIDNDQTVSLNYQRLLYETMAGVYSSDNNNKSVLTLRNELIGRIQISMKNVFGDLILNDIVDPIGGGAFYFSKGTSVSYHFKNLSAGEKSAFDLILDLQVKKKFYTDTIYCIDELETHLHTQVQGKLLTELVSIVPDNSQLWITTHSLGVLRAAQKMSRSDPKSVCIIDFDVLDPDVPRTILPSSLDRITWEKMISISLDDLSPRLAPAVIIVCEGSSVGSRRRNFDAEIYNRILGAKNPEIVFVSGGSSTQIEVHGISVRQTLGDVLPETKIISLCDRDDKSDEEVRSIEAGNALVLPFRNLESFLFDDSVIRALVEQQGKAEKLNEALEVKDTALTNSIGRGNSPDDIKSAAGEIYVGLKQLLDLQRCGNTADAFMRDTLAPLITVNSEIYATLKDSIIDRALSKTL